MKKVFQALIGLICICFAFAGCSRSEPEKKKEGANIALLNASSGNAWRAQMESEMAELIRQYQSEGLVQSYAAYSANDDATVQSQQLSQLVNAGDI
ncbi:MAG: hypothetical protein LBS06_00975, partial [Treponema sp.]|nr:hypothetical protein [Treponema sp.]